VTSSGLVVEIIAARVERVQADALLLPVDGAICRLGGAAAGAVRAALAPDERAEEMEYLEDELARLRPLPHPQARAIDGVARWKTIIVSAAYPHNVDGIVYSPDDCARMLRAAVPQAISLAAELGLASIAATLIGTAYRMSVDQAIRAFADGLAGAAKHPIRVCWSLPESTHRELAEVACRQRGLVNYPGATLA
jgi:O-acetyl-ADP-ribose deacetylase (regulator of RNase III)